jgi:ABC-type uncharacterized transport system substrate-binding protein
MKMGSIKKVAAIALLIVLGRPADGAALVTALVLVGSRNEPYETALGGLKTELKLAGIDVTVIRATNGKFGDLRHSMPSTYQAIAALGPEALSEAVAIKLGVPIVAGMVLATTVAKEGSAEHLIAVTVDVPFEMLLERLRIYFRQMSRVGVIRNPARSDPNESQLEDLGRRNGVKVITVECSRIEMLPEVYSKLAGSVDVVICFPDASLYNSTTIEALILASIRMKVPLAGFSEGFARAGAILSVYPDYEAAGRATGAAVRAVLNGKDSKLEWPLRNFHTALNTRVARMTGLKPSLRTAVDLTVIQ